MEADQHSKLSDGLFTRFVVRCKSESKLIFPLSVHIVSIFIILSSELFKYIDVDQTLPCNHAIVDVCMYMYIHANMRVCLCVSLRVYVRICMSLPLPELHKYKFDQDTIFFPL